MKDELHSTERIYFFYIEQTHLILPVGRWVLKTAMESLERIATIDSRSKNECEYVICASKSK